MQFLCRWRFWFCFNQRRTDTARTTFDDGRLIYNAAGPELVGDTHASARNDPRALRDLVGNAGLLSAVARPGSAAGIHRCSRPDLDSTAGR